ncbi:Protein translocase subunit SecDF [bioreactor metagenome]|uniref:Protein translocase subunit SecDF n=1 Tax=bioreactor metagenome TaxID=1076179 RepID=A0A644XK25_9ZZZZ
MKKSKLYFVIVLVFIAAMAFANFQGVSQLGIPAVTDTKNGIRLGLDLVGGSYMTYEVRDSQNIDQQELADGMSTVVQLLQGRLDSLGYSEATMSKVGTDRVTIEIPSVGDPAEAEAKLGSTAELNLLDSDGTVVLTGSDILSAKPLYGKTTKNGADEYFVRVSLSEAGQKAFYDATARMSTQEKIAAKKNYILIVLDGKVQSSPSVSSAINSDEFIIEGHFTEESVKWLAHVISAGRLPFALDLIDSSSIGPTLGEKSLDTGLVAGAIGLGLVMLFMLIFYRLPGLVADIALVFYMLLVGLTLSVMHINLSLPGIAGIILSIGMAVDANIVIFERIKEELRFGKTVRSAVKAGFTRATAAIVDSNVTTIIAGLVLKFLGSGLIVSFANTLLIGVIASMFTAIVISHILLNGFVEFGATKLSLFGVKSEEKPLTEPKFGFVAKRTIFLTCAIVVLAVGMGSLFYQGFELDVDFTGGTKLTLDTHMTLDREKMDEIANVVEDTVGSRPTIQKSGDGTVAILKMKELGTEDRAALFTALEKSFGITADDRQSIQNISATVGDELTRKAMISVAVTTLLMLIYIAIRFELRSGFVAVIMLMHDVLVLLTVYTIFRIPINTSVIAAILTIVGYSINATIVIFDRIRENKKLYSKRPFDSIVDLSISQTMMRSIGTTVTTLMTVVTLYILGVTSVRAFAFPLIVGILAGFYSSVLLAGPVWAAFRKS